MPKREILVFLSFLTREETVCYTDKKDVGETAMTEQLWRIEDKYLIWEPKEGQVHRDDLEMSGFCADYIVSYGIHADGSLYLAQSCYFPTLRTIPNNTHATYHFDVSYEESPRLLKDGMPVAEFPVKFVLDGTLQIFCRTQAGVSVRHRFYPSQSLLCCVQEVEVTAVEDVTLTLSMPSHSVFAYGRGTKGVYPSEISHTAPKAITLASGESLAYYIFYSARIAHQPFVLPDGKKELEARLARVHELCDQTLLPETGNPMVDVMFRFAKLRAGESIFDTLTGRYHSPGGHDCRTEY